MTPLDRTASTPTGAGGTAAATTSPRSASSTPPARPITLALEGGGSLGAFAWGVLDRLLEVPDLRIAVVSGTSAGAMNAAMLVQRLATGGPLAAKRLQSGFYRGAKVGVDALLASACLLQLFPPSRSRARPTSAAATQATHLCAP